MVGHGTDMVGAAGVDPVLVADDLPELHRLGLYWKCRGREIQGYEKADLLVYWTVSMYVSGMAITSRGGSVLWSWEPRCDTGYFQGR